MSDIPPDQRGPTGGLAPYLTIKGGRAGEAIDFYVKAFGAEEVMRMPGQNGKLMHAFVRVNGDPLLLSDDFPEFGDGQPSPDPGGFTLHLQVDDADRWFQRALDAGCTVKMPIADMFWGDRYGQLQDPYGVRWSIGGPQT